MSETKLLSGYRIAFCSTIQGMGGSEVLVTDAMEAACLAGATVDCWSIPKSATKELTAQRLDRFQVHHHDWPQRPSPAEVETPPTGNLPAASLTPGRNGTHAPRARLSVTRSLKKLWRNLVPEPIAELIGYKRYGRAFARVIAPTRPDLLFVNMNGHDHCSLAAEFCGIPLVNCYHISYTPDEGNWASRWVVETMRKDSIKRGTLTIHTSRAVRDQWSSMYHEPLERTRIVYNGVDPISYQDRMSTRAKLGLRESDFVICIPGRLAKMKGHRYLIEALPKLGDRLNRVQVLICGDGVESDCLQALVAENQVSQAVRFLGWRKDLTDLLHASDVTVLPSIYSENLSVAVLESLMAGTPAIVSNVGGMSEAILEGQTGYVVPPRDKDALANALLKLIDNHSLAAEMRIHARADAMKRFTRERMMKEYVAVFAELLKPKSS